MWTTEYNYFVGPSPTGGKITQPSYTWYNGNPYHYFDQAVVTTSPGYYSIACNAVWNPQWDDKDIIRTITCGYSDSTVNDDPLGTGFWWSDGGADGTFNDQSDDDPVWTPGNTIGIVTLTLYIRDNATYANDSDTLATGNPHSVSVIVYDSHLERDRNNFDAEFNDPLVIIDSYGHHSSNWNCHSASNHAYNGQNGGVHLTNLSFINPPNFAYDNEYSYAYDYDQLNFSKGDVIVFYSQEGTVVHSVTAVGDGQTVYQANYYADGTFYECTIEDIFNNHQHDQYFKCKIYRKN